MVLAPVGSDVGSTVGAVMIGVLARVHDVRDPEAWPTDEQAQQSRHDVRLGGGFKVHLGDDVFLAGWTADRGRIGTNLGCRDYRVNVGGLTTVATRRDHVCVCVVWRWWGWMWVAVVHRRMWITGAGLWLILVRIGTGYESGSLARIRRIFVVHVDCVVGRLAVFSLSQLLLLSRSIFLLHSHFFLPSNKKSSRSLKLRHAVSPFCKAVRFRRATKAY